MRYRQRDSSPKVMTRQMALLIVSDVRCQAGESLSCVGAQTSKEKIPDA